MSEHHSRARVYQEPPLQPAPTSASPEPSPFVTSTNVATTDEGLTIDLGK
jgi:hypothetical protein